MGRGGEAWSIAYQAAPWQTPQFWGHSPEGATVHGHDEVPTRLDEHPMRPMPRCEMKPELVGVLLAMSCVRLRRWHCLTRP
jgi:hypothetical protein